MQKSKPTLEVSNTYISNDIAFSILSKLPLKSFKRFECVRKSWSLLFENNLFMNMFRNNLLSNSYYDGASIVFNVYDKSIHEYVFYSLSNERFENKVKLDFPDSFERSYLRWSIFGFGSIDGTLCLYENENCIDDSEIVLWNPTTQTIKHLPCSLDQSIVYYYLHGFGYDDLINDYKVIRYVSFFGKLNRFAKSLEGLWEIYSLRSNSRRKLDVDMPFSFDCEEGTQVYMDGVCHWLCEKDNPAGECLVSFYLSNEMFFITPMPSDRDVCFGFGAWINLAVLNGSIALFAFNFETTTFNISILGELGVEESWFKLFIVGPFSCVDRPIGVGAKGEIFFLREDKELVYLDLSTQTIVELAYKGENFIHRIIIYKEKFFQLEE